MKNTYKDYVVCPVCGGLYTGVISYCPYCRAKEPAIDDEPSHRRRGHGEGEILVIMLLSVVPLLTVAGFIGFLINVAACTLFKMC